MILRFLLIWLCVCWAGTVWAKTLSPTKNASNAAGSAVEFLAGDYVVALGIDLPVTGWEADANPNMNHDNRAGQRWKAFHTMGGRFYFDSTVAGGDPFAIYTIGMRGNFSVSLNGTEVFRNFADVGDQKNPWYRPFLIPVSDDVLVPGTNEILVHSFSRKHVGIGRILVGSNAALEAYYTSRYFWHITAPIASGFTMLVVGALVFVLWFWRKNEVELLWLSLATIIWFVRNHQYYAEEIPQNYSLYAGVTILATYFAVAATAAFYFCAIRLPYRNQIIFVMFLIGFSISYARSYLALPSSFVYLPTTVILTLIAIVALHNVFRHRNLESGVLGFGLLVMPFLSLHDVIMLQRHAGDGHATYLALFCGAIYTGAFLISFGKRVLDAFEDLGRSNMVLEQTVAETRADLMKSEEQRRALLVDQALTNERARLMQEMHDGIGSNLTTALAVARQQYHPDTSIEVLKRALGDLKLTVDSLEPVEGDLVALIGNLRHRMARDLSDAGITCKWEVEECKPLDWLDATNALHVLRIHNEAISNVLAHSNATEMRIGCLEDDHDGVPGITTYVADNGDGMDTAQPVKGKGLLNIQARAHSLHGQLDYQSRPGEGTCVKLWLPYAR